VIDPTLKVVRTLLTNWFWALLFPITMLLVSAAVNMAVWAAVGKADMEGAWSGGLVTIYIVQLTVTWAGLSQHFSFAVGLNVTRRAFYTGLTFVVLGQSVLFGLFVYLSALLERATGSWGIGLKYFDPLSFLGRHPVAALLMYTVPMALVSCLGVFVGAIAKRWGAFGLFGLTLTSIVFVGFLGVLIGLLHGWPSVGSWLANQSALSIFAGWALLPTVLFAVGGYAVLRQAVP
jgi:hypothetical protein